MKINICVFAPDSDIWCHHTITTMMVIFFGASVKSLRLDTPSWCGKGKPVKHLQRPWLALTRKKKKTGGKDPLPTLNRLHLGKSGKVDVYCGDAKQTARANKKKLKILSQSTQVSRTPIRSDTSRSWCEFAAKATMKDATLHLRCGIAHRYGGAANSWKRLGFWMFLRKHNPNCHGRFTFSIYTSINMSCLKCKR